MSGYKLNTPYRDNKPTKWFMLLSAISDGGWYHKREWLRKAGIEFSEVPPEVTITQYGYKKFTHPYRHWRGIYPDLFPRLQSRGWVEYVRGSGWRITKEGQYKIRSVHNERKALGNQNDNG